PGHRQWNRSHQAVTRGKKRQANWRSSAQARQDGECRMQEYENLRYVVEAGIARLTLNRPSKGNALSMALRAELRPALLDVAENPDVRALVLSGEGTNFCTGGDIGDMQQAAISDGGHGRERLRQSSDMVEQLVHLDKPVVALVQGHAAG